MAVRPNISVKLFSFLRSPDAVARHSGVTVESRSRDSKVATSSSCFSRMITAAGPRVVHRVFERLFSLKMGKDIPSEASCFSL